MDRSDPLSPLTVQSRLPFRCLFLNHRNYAEAVYSSVCLNILRFDISIDFYNIALRAGPTPQTLGGRKKILSNILARLRKLWGGVKKFCQIYYVKTKAFTDFLIFLNINSSKKKLKSKNFQLLGGRYTPQASPVGPALIALLDIKVYPQYRT